MFTIKDYVVAKSLEEAYELNQKRSNLIIGGMLWLKMSHRVIQTAIDLSQLGLDKIVETEDQFEIGCMCTLGNLEVHKTLNDYFGNIIKESVRHIVGVQFRNGATIGGSVYSRFGFSDILAALLALDSYVQLYKGGIIPLSQFVTLPYDNDILVRIIIKKIPRKTYYETYRNSATDFPTLICAISKSKKDYHIVLGATPKKATRINGIDKILDGIPTGEQIKQVIDLALEQVVFESNLRGSKEYRRRLAAVFIERGMQAMIREEI